MCFKKCLHWTVIVLYSGIVFLLLSDGGICGSPLPLDKETVFCIYYKMSGENMEEQDLEELCRNLGRPTFTAYKPSEMFVKNTLRDLKCKLTEKTKALSGNSMFRWSLKRTLGPDDSGIYDHTVTLLNNDMPQPTVFIGSEMTERGRRFIHRLLHSLVSKSSNQAEERAVNITVYLRPEKIFYRFQHRNIAREDIYLPFRSVIFHPIKIEVCPLKNPDRILLACDIP